MRTDYTREHILLTSADSHQLSNISNVYVKVITLVKFCFQSVQILISLDIYLALSFSKSGVRINEITPSGIEAQPRS
jgi:hypothetical protein